MKSTSKTPGGFTVQHARGGHLVMVKLHREPNGKAEKWIARGRVGTRMESDLEVVYPITTTDPSTGIRKAVDTWIDAAANRLCGAMPEFNISGVEVTPGGFVGTDGWAFVVTITGQITDEFSTFLDLRG